jgi:hypothetical protein
MIKAHQKLKDRVKLHSLPLWKISTRYNLSPSYFSQFINSIVRLKTKRGKAFESIRQIGKFLGLQDDEIFIEEE